MPIYQCAAPRGLLTAEMKARVAAAITDAHVEATGAPRVFLHVFFNELLPGVAHSAGELDNKISGITASWARASDTKGVRGDAYLDPTGGKTGGKQSRKRRSNADPSGREPIRQVEAPALAGIQKD